MDNQLTEKSGDETGLYRMSANRRPEADLQEIIAASGISTRLWRLYAYFWLICLLFPILSLLQDPLKAWQMLFAAAGLVTFTAVYFWTMWPHPLSAHRPDYSHIDRSIILLLALTFFTLLLVVLYGRSFLWLLIGVSAIAGIRLPFARASIAVMALTLLTLAVSILTWGGATYSDWLLILPLVLLVRGLGLDMIGFLRLSDALRELHGARRELARQAVTEERLRMARDLHDLLGHTLSLITLKSELAGRLLEKDPTSAEQEIQDIEQVARQALRDVREAVAGYRQESLQSELEGARQILEAAGIACTVEFQDQEIPANVATTLVWVIREGVTNVIRHSRAQHCQIKIRASGTKVLVEILNDGYVMEQGRPKQPGSGLSGLADRVAERGGHVESGPGPVGDQPGFHLEVSIPIQNPSPVEVR